MEYYNCPRTRGEKPKTSKAALNKLIRKFIFFGVFIFPWFPKFLQAQEAPNFSILFHTGGGLSDGFLGSGTVLPEGGLWLGIGLSNNFDGLWGMDYYSLPNQPITFTLQPSKTDPSNSKTVQPTDAIALTVNTRWYWGNKFDPLHQNFNTLPYLVGGLGMDLVVDEYPRPPNSRFYNAKFDALLSFNLGAGMDFPLGKANQWFFYSEVLDHLIIWQGLTQVMTVRLGLKVMMDSEHLDPFR